DPEPSSPMVLVRRRGSAATFAAIHEPYSVRPVVRTVSLLEESTEGIGMKVEGEGYSDRLLVAFGSSSTSILLRSPEGEEFRFAGYGLVRAAGKEVVARGKIEGFRIRVGDRRDLSLTVNGKKETTAVRGEFLVYGNVSGEAAAVRALPPSRDAAETR